MNRKPNDSAQIYSTLLMSMLYFQRLASVATECNRWQVMDSHSVVGLLDAESGRLLTNLIHNATLVGRGRFSEVIENALPCVKERGLSCILGHMMSYYVCDSNCYFYDFF